MGLLELCVEALIQLGVIEGFCFGQKIDGDVGRTKKVCFLDNGSGEGRIQKGCALKVGLKQFGFTQVSEMQLGLRKIGAGEVGPGE